MPIRRHRALAPLSRHHHLALQLARGLRAGASEHLRATLPDSAAGRAAHVRRVFAAELEPHFREEEAVLIPAVSGRTTELDALCAEILAEHAELRGIVSSLADAALPPSALDAILDELGRRLESHVRKEERSFYERVQEALPEAELGRLAASLEPCARAEREDVSPSAQVVPDVPIWNGEVRAPGPAIG